MKRVLKLCLFLVCLYTPSQAQHTYGLCSQAYQMHQYCTNNEQSSGSVAPTIVEGKVGKQGVKGDTGPPGVVNYTAIEKKLTKDIKSQIDARTDEYERTFADIRRIIENDREVQRTAMEDMNRKILNMTLTLEREEHKAEALCKGLFYKRKCFVPVMDKNVNYAQARDICAAMSGKLADIYDMTHFDLMMNEIRKKHMGKTTYVELYVGMTIQPSTGQVSLTDGTKVAYLSKWWPGYPTKQQNHNILIFSVRSDASNTAQYLYNYPPSVPSHPFCEI